jgi:hypothetical protein
MVVHTYIIIPTVGKLRQEDHEFRDSLDCRTRPYLKKQNICKKIKIKKGETEKKRRGEGESGGKEEKRKNFWI